MESFAPLISWPQGEDAVTAQPVLLLGRVGYLTVVLG